MPFDQMLLNPEFQKKSRKEQEQLYAWAMELDLKKNAGLSQELGETGIQQVAQYAARTFKPKVPGKESVELTDYDRQRFEEARLSVPGGVPGAVIDALGMGKVIERIFRGTGPDDEIKYAYWLGEKAAAGDVEAISEIKQYQIQKEITSQSLIGKAMTLGKDAFEYLVLGDKELDIGLNRETRENITEYLYRQLPNSDQAQTEMGAKVIGGAVSLGELLGASILTAGTSLAPGLLTKGIFSATAAGVRNTTGAARLFFKAADSFAVESIMSGALSVVQQLPEDLQKGKYVDSNGTFGRVASSFGSGLAFDMAANVMMDVARIFVKPAFKVLLGKSLDQAAKKTGEEFAEFIQNASPDNVARAFQEVIDGKISPETLGQLDTEGQKKLMEIAARAQSWASGKILKKDSDEFVPLLGKAAGFDVDLTDGKFVISRAGTVQDTFSNRADAINFLAINKKFTMVPDELVEYAGQTGAKLKARVRGTVNIDEIPTDTLTTLTMEVDEVGRTNSKNVSVAMKNLIKRSDSNLSPEVLDGIKHTTINEDTFRRNVQNIPDMLKKHPDVMYVPKTMNDPSTKKMFGEYLTAFGKNKTPLFGNLPIDYANKLSITETGLQTIAKNLNAGSLLKVQDRWVLKYLSPEGKPVESQFFSLEQANVGVGKALIETGNMDEAEVIESIRDEFGVSISSETKDMFSTYVAKDFQGNLIAKGNSLSEIITQHPELSPRYPARMGPEFYFVDDKGTIDIQRTVATGPFNDLLKLTKNFKGSQVKSQWKVLDSKSDGTIKLSTSGKFANRYAVTLDDVGFKTEFGSLKAARDYMSSQENTWTDVRSLAQLKGFDLATTGNGKIGVTNFEGHQSVVNNLAEAKLFLQRAPTSESHRNLVTAITDEMDNEIIGKVRSRLEEIDPNSVKPKWMDPKIHDSVELQKQYLNPRSLKNFLDEFVSPAFSAMEQMGKRLGLPEIPLKAEQYSILSRQAARGTLVGNRYIRSIFSPGGKMIDRKTADALGEIFEMDPKDWATRASMLGFDLKPEHEAMMRGSRAYMDRLSEVFGVDAHRYLTNYVPKMRRSIGELISENGIENLTKNSILERSFGKGWRGNKEVNFFAKNLRNEAFIDVVKNQTNIIDQMAYYTEHGYREMYLGDFFSGIKEWYKNTLGKVENLDKTVADRVQEFYNVASGHAVYDDPLSRAVEMKSYQLTSGFADSMDKIFGDKMKPLTDWARRQITTDLPGKASAMVTHATLNFRPFRGVANLFQYVNTFGVFGDKSLDVIKKVTDVDVERMFQKGIITQNVFSKGETGGFTNFKSILEKGLKGQQQSEYLTRAWTARCAEESFDEAITRFANKTIDLKGFLSESRMNIMDDTAIQRALDLIKSGNPTAARDLFATQSIRILMFDYAKENYPMAFKGVVGKMFGKFGVFPVGQVDLYRRILRSGSWQDKAINAARFVTASTVVYNAFRMAGVDYSGFQMGDCFGFSGGPLYKAGQDVLRAGSEGPDGAMARRSLMRNFFGGVDSETGAFEFPRLVMPGALQLNSMLKGWKFVGDDNYRAFITAFGAPFRKDWMNTGSRIW